MKQLKYKDMFTLKKRPKIQLLCFSGGDLLNKIRTFYPGRRSGSDPTFDSKHDPDLTHEKKMLIQIPEPMLMNDFKSHFFLKKVFLKF